MKTIKDLSLGDFVTSDGDFAVVKEENGVHYYANYDCVDISNDDIIHYVSDIDTDYLEENEAIGFFEGYNLDDENTPFNWYNVGDVDNMSKYWAGELVAANDLFEEWIDFATERELEYEANYNTISGLIYSILCM